MRTAYTRSSGYSMAPVGTMASRPIPQTPSNRTSLMAPHDTVSFGGAGTQTLTGIVISLTLGLAIWAHIETNASNSNQPTGQPEYPIQVAD